MSETSTRRQFAYVGLGRATLRIITAERLRKLRSFWRRRTAAFGVVLLILIALLALLPGVFATHDPIAINLRVNSEAPSAIYIFGTDNLGRDVYSRVVHGAHVTMLVALVSTTISVLIGTFLGLIGGFYGGLIDKLVLAFTDLGMAVPTLFLALVIIALLGPGLTNMTLAIALSGLPRYVYLVRPQVIILAKSDFVVASHGLGATSATIMWRHILPNLASSLIVLTSSRIAQAVLIESSLNFLSLGVAPPTPTWGNMIAEGRSYLTTAPWYPLAPGLFITLTVLGFNLVGDGLRDALDPRLKHEST